MFDLPVLSQAVNVVNKFKKTPKTQVPNKRFWVIPQIFFYFSSLFFFNLTVDGPNLTARDVSILVTQASPECPTAPTSKNRLLSEPSTSTLVHVLVHRESEEYQTDLEDGSTDKGTSVSFLSILRF